MVGNAAITGPHGKKDSYSEVCESRSEGEPREVPVQDGIERKFQEKEEECVADVMDHHRVERTVKRKSREGRTEDRDNDDGDVCGCHGAGYHRCWYHGELVHVEKRHVRVARKDGTMRCRKLKHL